MTYFNNKGLHVVEVNSKSGAGLKVVTPGLLPVLVQARPAKELINVDFPTLGIPTSIARTAD